MRERTSLSQDCQRTPVQRFCGIPGSCLGEYRAEVVEVCGYTDMLLSECLFINRKGSAQQRLCGCEISPLPKQQGQVRQALSGLGMVGTEQPFSPLQGLPIQ